MSSSIAALALKFEVLLHASDAPLSCTKAKRLLFDADKTSIEDQDAHFKAVVDTLKQRLEGGALQLYHSAQGYGLRIHPDHAQWVANALPQRMDHLSPALLETLSIIAYKQPVTRADIEYIRGVRVSANLLRQLFDRGWIVEKGHKDSPGRPALLHTTDQFLTAFNLSYLSELPDLPELDNPTA